MVKIISNLVQVDAVVTDKDGKLVTDLQTGEVQVFEDGKPQNITHFVYNVTGGQSQTSPVWLLPAGWNWGSTWRPVNTFFRSSFRTGWPTRNTGWPQSGWILKS